MDKFILFYLMVNLNYLVRPKKYGKLDQTDKILNSIHFVQFN